jgi:hypothetical protein
VTLPRGIGAGSAVLAWLALAVTVLAGSPLPSAGTGGDPRSSGQGPGLVGDPLFALIAVLAIGLVTVGVTLAWVRLTAGRSG